MKTKRTTGPWEVFQLADDQDTYSRDAGKWIVTAHEHQTEVCGVIETIQDARLIAAAPDLLEACIQARLCINHHGIVGDPASPLLDEAIHKAQGGE